MKFHQEACMWCGAPPAALLEVPRVEVAPQIWVTMHRQWSCGTTTAARMNHVHHINDEKEWNAWCARARAEGIPDPFVDNPHPDVLARHAWIKAEIAKRAAPST